MSFALGVAKHVPPPNTREEIIEAFAHCPDPRCPSTAQERVQVVNVITEWTFGSRGGGDDPGGLGNLFLPMSENTISQLRFLNDGAVPAPDGVNRVPDPDAANDSLCESCGKLRELSATERPVIPVTIGGQDALLRMQALGINAFDPVKQERISAGEKESPLEQLQRRYIADEIDDGAYQRKLAVIAPPESAQPRRAKKTVED